MPSVITLFCTILTGLRAALGACMTGRDRTPAVVWLGTQAFVPVQPPSAAPPIPLEILSRAWTRLGRAMQRLTRLYDRWQSNTLPKPRPSQAGIPRPNRPAKPYFPTKPAWLAGSTDHHVRGYASQLGHLLASPGATEFLTAVPRAGRILRPLCHMLGIDPPAPIVLPPKPRAPRPKKPPEPPIQHGKYTPAQIRRYSPGRIPKAPPNPA